MFGGIRVTICREGWYYLFVVLFILGGAVLREVNLLVVLAGMMIGPMLFNWRLVRAAVRDLSIDRKSPTHVSAGESIHVDVSITNHRSRLSCWTLIVLDRIRLEKSRDRRHRTQVELLYAKIPAGETHTATYTCRLHQRGRYNLGPARASSRFPLGLVQGAVTIRQKQQIIVCPQLGYLSERWLQMIEADRVGSQKTHHRRGLNEGDYYGLREWRPGDSIRWIHWRTTARIGELAVRQFEQQRNRDVAILVDLWQPEEPSEDDCEALELAISFAATVIVDLCRRGGSHLIAGISGHESQYWSAMTSTGFAQEILEALAVAQGGGGSELRTLVDRTVKENRPGIRTVVISTRASDLESWRETELDAIQDALLSRTLWMNAASEEISQFYRLENPTAG